LALLLLINDIITKVLRYGPCVTRGHTVSLATHKITITAFTPQLCKASPPFGSAH